VYLIAGQSNASGMANSSELSDAEATIPTNVELWINVSGVAGDHHLLTSHRDMPKFGLEVKLAKLLAGHYPTERLIIIKVSLGGTNMGHWISGGIMHALFFDTVSAILQGETPNYRNLFWMQGEQDMVTQARADLYENRTVSWFSDVRAAFGSTLVICMGLANPPVDGYPYQYGVANGQILIGKADQYTRLVTTQGLSKFSDGVHDDKAGLLELGRRMYCTAMGN